MKRLFPVVIQGDWMQLAHEEAEDRRSALINAAAKWVKQGNEDREGEDLLMLDPEGVVGEGTPDISIKVVDHKGVVDSIWTIPDEH